VELVTALAKDYVVGIEWLCPWNSVTELSLSEFLPMMMTTL
jgi:hypothetical protein